MSANTATSPVTVAPAGRTLVRIRVSSWVVFSSSGAVAGSTTMIAVSPARFTTGGATWATPASLRSVAASRSTSLTLVRSTATSSGPLAPGPYSAATRS